MKRFVIFIVLFLSFAHLAAAQEAAEITIFRDEDSLTIYVPEGGAIDGLALQVTTGQGEITRSIAEFSMFYGAPLRGEACFRLERAGSETPVPLECPLSALFIHTLADADVFWYDDAANLARPVLILSGDEMAGLCPGSDSSCRVDFAPQNGEDMLALCNGVGDVEDREVLVLIATFRQISGNSLEPHDEWEEKLNDAILQLGGRVNARVMVLPQIVTSQEEALRVSACYNATLVVWGIVTGAGVESNYTATARWSEIDTQPGQTDFEIDDASTKSVIDQLTIFVSKDGSDTNYILNFVLGQLTYFTGNFEESQSFFEQAIMFAPAGREREMGVAAMYFYKGAIQLYAHVNADAALDSFSSALEIDPDGLLADEAYNNRGITYFLQGNNAAAISDFTNAITIDPQYADAYYNRGNAYYVRGDIPQAIADYTQAIDIQPDAVTYYNRGNIFREQGDYVRAIDDYTAAVKIEPRFVDAYNNRGIAHLLAGDAESALDDYQQAVTRDPEFASGYAGLGGVYDSLGRTDEALTNYRRYVELAGENADAGIVARIGELEAEAEN